MQSERVHCRILGSCHRAKLGSKRMVGAAFLSIFVLNVVVYLVSQSEFLHSWFDCAFLAEKAAHSAGTWGTATGATSAAAACPNVCSAGKYGTATGQTSEQLACSSACAAGASVQRGCC